MQAEQVSVEGLHPADTFNVNHCCHAYCAGWNSARCAAGGAAYLFYLSRKLAAAVAGVTALLWIVALCYGNFSRKAQRTYQDALAETNQAGLWSQHLMMSIWNVAFLLSQAPGTCSLFERQCHLCVQGSAN